MNKLSKEYLKFNKNLLTSFIFSVIVSAMTAQLLAKQEYYLNTTYAIIVGYVVYFTVFGILFRLRQKTRDYCKKKQNLKKVFVILVTLFGIGEVFYLLIRWVTHYYFLTIEFEPYLASLTSETISMAFYMVVVTLVAKITGLLKVL